MLAENRALVLVRERADRGEDGDADEGDRDGEGVGEGEPEVGGERHESRRLPARRQPDPLPFEGHDLRHHRKLHQGRLVHRGLSGGLHPPEARGARLRDRRAALHRPRGAASTATPASRPARSTRSSPSFERPEKYEYALDAQRASSSPRRARSSARPPDAARAIAGGDRRRGAGRGVRRRRLLRAAATPRSTSSSGCPRRGGCCAAASRPTTRRSSACEDTFDRHDARAAAAASSATSRSGADVSHAELMRHYHAVIYATGAQTDKSLGHPRRGPARELGRHRVRRLVQRPPRLPRRSSSTSRASAPSSSATATSRRTSCACSRASPTSSSAPTSPTTRSRRCARAGSRRSSCSAGAGRRRPRSRAPSCASSADIDGVDMRVDPAEVELDPVSRGVAGRGGDVHRAQERRAAARVRGRERRRAGARGRIELRFLRSPVEIRGDGPRRGDRRRDATRSCATTTARCGRGRSTDAVETIACGLVLRSVGYRRCRCPTCRSTSAASCCRTTAGACSTPRRRGAPRRLRRRLDQARAHRASSGTNKRDAEETVAPPRRGPPRRAPERARRGGDDRRAPRRARRTS